MPCGTTCCVGPKQLGRAALQKAGTLQVPREPVVHRQEKPEESGKAD